MGTETDLSACVSDGTGIFRDFQGIGTGLAIEQRLLAMCSCGEPLREGLAIEVRRMKEKRERVSQVVRVQFKSDFVIAARPRWKLV